MRFIKTFGLAVVAAVAAMAFVGASSAMATDTALCGAHEEPCASGNQLSAIHVVAVNPTLETLIIDITCASSLASASILALGNPQIGHVTSLTWQTCEANGNSCSVITVLAGLALLLKTGLNAGDVQFHDTVVEVECPFVDCAYGGLPTLKATGASSKSAGQLVASKLVLTEDDDHSDGFCGGHATWDATYLSLSNIYIVS